MYIAHVKRNDKEQWEEPHWLEDHLKGTAERASNFAKIFDSEAWAYAAGLGHDSGKSPDKWQKYLTHKSGYDETAHLEAIPGKLDHSAPGAKLIEELYGKGCGRILSYCISGHHAGLPDLENDTQGSLLFRLQQAETKGIPEAIRTIVLGGKPDKLPRRFDNNGLDLSLWIRMLFSCLVDADFLDTENYMDPLTHSGRNDYLSLKDLRDRFNNYMDGLTSRAASTEVNRVRQTVLTDCLAAASMKPGFFSLTVPTGGGKTLSSMAFALEHAAAYGKDRIIYVIPYTSIIEQNADVFRGALGADQVVEHHSNLAEAEVTTKNRLASENWDAPVIVTTSVQFFESLFSAKSSRCRKLHNLCNSVVILDEAQLLPAEHLSPILRALELLVSFYKVTFLLCTATQPALKRQETAPSFPGLEKHSIREVMKDVPGIYRKLKRVQVEIPTDLITPCSWNAVAGELLKHDKVLCIVSDRKSCRTLHGMMPEDTYHLSALMCAEHRSEVIAEIKEGLRRSDSIRVISTQLVEAGVDLDFPVVFRAMAGLDSLAQASGRCNREGLLNHQGKLGRVVIFIPPKQPPRGILRKAAETTVRMLKDGLEDPLDQSVFQPFFTELYWKAHSLDEKDIIGMLTPDHSELGIRFRTAGASFRLIDDTMQRSLLVPYGEGAELIHHVKIRGPERRLLRKLQRYTVNIYNHEFNDFRNRGSLEEISPGIFSLICEVEYDEKTGLKTDENLFDPEKYNV